MKPRWGLIVSVANAAGGTGFVLYVWDTSWRVDPPPLVVVEVAALSLASAWIGAWAWSRARWSIAAAALFASVAIPWGYLFLIAGPAILGLSATALVRAFRAHRGADAVSPSRSDAR